MSFSRALRSRLATVQPQGVRAARMARMSAVLRNTSKLCACGFGALGTAKLTQMFINDDLDDIPYSFASLGLGRAERERKRVVVLGSGWGAISFARKLDHEAYHVTVISPRPFFFYTPLLVGSTTGVVSPGAIIEPIRDCASRCDFLRVACQDVDLEQRRVLCDNGLSLPYDHLVVAVGAQPNTFGIPGVAEHGLFLKEVEHGRAVRKRMLDLMEMANVAFATGDLGEVRRLLSFVVVGGGPTGVEFCGELADFIRQDLKLQYPNIAEHVKVTLVEAMPSLLTMFDKAVGEHVQEHLRQQGIGIMLGSSVQGVDERKIQLKTPNGPDEASYGMLVWVAGMGARPFTRALGEKIGKESGQSDRRGLVVDGCLRVAGTRLGEVFAIGDCAVSGSPPTAQVAYQQGKYLGRMFRFGCEASIADAQAAAFEYNHQGSMAYVGDGKAAAEVDPNSIAKKLGSSPITNRFFWRSLYGDESHVKLMGAAGFALWRSVYFSKLMSARTRFCVASDWLRTSLFGRPAASSVQGLV